jgi:hypothetical protein
MPTQERATLGAKVTFLARERSLGILLAAGLCASVSFLEQKSDR